MSVLPARPQGEVFLDARGNGRAMRLTWHHEADMVVLSMWRNGTCAGTFRLAKDDVNEFIDALIDGIRDAPGVQVLPGSSRPATLADPVLPVETGESTFPELSETEQPAFTEWAFGEDDRANAS